jgi:hypothetical protein
VICLIFAHGGSRFVIRVASERFPVRADVELDKPPAARKQHSVHYSMGLPVEHSLSPFVRHILLGKAHIHLTLSHSLRDLTDNRLQAGSAALQWILAGRCQLVVKNHLHTVLAGSMPLQKLVSILKPLSTRWLRSPVRQRHVVCTIQAVHWHMEENELTCC